MEFKQHDGSYNDETTIIVKGEIGSSKDTNTLKAVKGRYVSKKTNNLDDGKGHLIIKRSSLRKRVFIRRRNRMIERYRNKKVNG